MRGISWLAAKSVSFSRRTLLHGVNKYQILCVWFQWLFRYHHQIKLQRNFCRAAMLPFYILKKKLPSPTWHIFKEMLLYIIYEHQIVTLVTSHKVWVFHFFITDWGKLRKCVVGLVSSGTTFIANFLIVSCRVWKLKCIASTHTHRYGEFIGLFFLLKKVSKGWVKMGFTCCKIMLWHQ